MTGGRRSPGPIDSTRQTKFDSNKARQSCHKSNATGRVETPRAHERVTQTRPATFFVWREDVSDTRSTRVTAPLRPMIMDASSESENLVVTGANPTSLFIAILTALCGGSMGRRWRHEMRCWRRLAMFR